MPENRRFVENQVIVLGNAENSADGTKPSYLQVKLPGFERIESEMFTF